jgi:hypothetical protein
MKISYQIFDSKGNILNESVDSDYLINILDVKFTGEGFYRVYDKDCYIQLKRNFMKEKIKSTDGGKYDDKGNSSHYQSQFMEFIRDIERKYGTIVALLVCQSNVDKYNQRAGLKEGVSVDKDITKRNQIAPLLQ